MAILWVRFRLQDYLLYMCMLEGSPPMEHLAMEATLQAATTVVVKDTKPIGAVLTHTLKLVVGLLISV